MPATLLPGPGISLSIPGIGCRDNVVMTMTEPDNGRSQCPSGAAPQLMHVAASRPAPTESPNADQKLTLAPAPDRGHLQFSRSRRRAGMAGKY
jgi:hypothetical protein